MGDIAGILLAAGYGRRFGADKRLAALADGTPLAVAAARKLRAACDRTLVVIRPEDEALAGQLAGEGVDIVSSAEARLGMGHSLAAGVAASRDAGGWLIALADMPFIEAASYAAVVAALRDGASLAQPEHGGRPGHPVGFSAIWLPKLLALSGDSGARELVRGAPARVLCPVDDPGVHRDIDSPADIAP